MGWDRMGWDEFVEGEEAEKDLEQLSKGMEIR